MTLPVPNLDDRTCKELLEEVKQKAYQICPDWDLNSVSDPGVVLLELFSYLTEMMLYRVNKIPEKVYVTFLQLMGIQLQPPSSASVNLKLYRDRSLESCVTVPKGTRVTTIRASGTENSPVFVTTRTVNLEPDQTEVNVLAYHCESVDADLLGYGNGMPGLSVKIKHPPVIAPTEDEKGDLQIGVEATAEELGNAAPFKEFGGKKYRLWTLVDNFTGFCENDYVFTADRMNGIITFAPSVGLKNTETGKIEPASTLGRIPKNSNEIRAWYRIGGGTEGNVAKNMLIRLKDPIPGIKVTNEVPALGGQAGESLENAVLRGPSEIRSLERVVTARDFELVAKRNSGTVARARAYTKADLWPFALTGTVEVLLVPKVPADQVEQNKLSIDILTQHQTDGALARVKHALDERRPLGTTCHVRWVRFKLVTVKARLAIDREHDAGTVKKQVLKRLNKMINPLPDSKGYEGWRFGQPLHVSRVYGLIMSQSGVRYIDGQVKLAVEDSPNNEVKSIVTDAFRSDFWYIGSGDSVYRSVNNCDGWELTQSFAGEEVLQVTSHPKKAGIVVALTRKNGEGVKRYRLYLSRDCGETWERDNVLADFAFQVYSMVWTPQEKTMRLLLATKKGLYEVRPGKGPLQIAVGSSDKDGFTNVIAKSGPGVIRVVVSGRQGGGVYVSDNGGRANSFKFLGLKNEDVRVLAIQQDGPRHCLWAGITAVGNVKGKGCYFYDLTNPAAGWENYNEGWRGGSCYSFAFDGTQVYAGSFHGGVLELNISKTKPTWNPLLLGSGLPIRPDSERLYPVEAVAVTSGENGRLLVGTEVGLFSADINQKKYSFRECSQIEFVDKVTLPDTWLFCSGQHEIEIMEELNAD